YNPFTSAPNGAVTALELDGMTLAPSATVFAQQGSTLQLGTTASATGFLLQLQGSMTKTGGGQLLIETSSIASPTSPLLNAVPVNSAAGSLTLGQSAELNALNFDVASGASFIVADNAAAGIRSLTGSGFVNLAGTSASTDTTSLTILLPVGSTDA